MNKPFSRSGVDFYYIAECISTNTGAYIWSVLFFVLITVAALTSTISLCEVAIAFLHEEFHFTRRRASQILIFICLVMSTLCSLSFGPLSDFYILGFSIFNFCDFLASNILLPAGGMLISIFVGWKLDRQFIKEELSNHGVSRVWYFGILMFCMRFVAPGSYIFDFFIRTWIIFR